MSYGVIDMPLFLFNPFWPSWHTEKCNVYFQSVTLTFFLFEMTQSDGRPQHTRPQEKYNLRGFNNCVGGTVFLCTCLYNQNCYKTNKIL